MKKFVWVLMFMLIILLAGCRYEANLKCVRIAPSGESSYLVEVKNIGNAVGYLSMEAIYDSKCSYASSEPIEPEETFEAKILHAPEVFILKIFTNGNLTDQVYYTRGD